MRTKLIWAALAALCVATPALADACKPIQLLNSVDMTPVGDGGQMLVPVSINGVQKKMLLSTAGAITALYPRTVAAMDLRPLESGLRLLDAAGNASNRYVELDFLQIGRLLGTHVRMMVSTSNGGKDGTSDGILAGDVLDRYDIEMDFAAHKLNYFSPDHCVDQVIYWPATAVALVSFTQNQPVRDPIGFGAMQRSDTTHIRVPVTLDGKQFWATINTGSTGSTMSAAVAKYTFGITADSPGSAPTGEVGGNPDNKVFSHVFDSLTFDGVTISHPHITVIPDLVGSKDKDNDLETGSRIQHVDDGIGAEVSIGMDVLKHLHLYIAYRSQKLYITPAAAAPMAPATGK